jgi:endo-1,4-beta-xylanase
MVPEPFVLARRPSSAAYVVALSLLASCLLPPPAPPGGATAAAENPPALQVPALRAAAEALPGGRRIGAAVAVQHLGLPAYRKTLAFHFNSVTAENDMKWAYVEPAPGQFSFRAGDELVAFAAENGMRVRGHTLVWHTQLASWVGKLSGDALRAAMVRHVKGEAGHWKGKIAQWDVVNEAFADGEAGELRHDSPFTALGPGFIDDAFRAAHEADPAAQLFYNDYEIEGLGSAKAEAVFRMVSRMKAAGVPIDGVGFQMHVDPRRWPAADQIRRNLERFAALGLAVELTEMDVPVGEIAGGNLQKLEQQRILTHDIVAACVAVRRCSGITFWGFTDRYSWLNDPRWGALRGRLPHRPLPFDADYRPKPMVAAIAEALAGR